MEYTAQNLEYAVSVFYNGEQTERAKAHAWLTTAQRVPEAWNFVWELLQPNKGTEIQFYAATTLHTKILRCWNEVPPESYEELKNKILQSVFTYSSGPKIVTNRLCISLAAFILQQGTIDLATILRPLSTVGNTTLLLEVLTVIPEEFNSMTMGSSLRARNRTSLQQACPAVLDDMLQYLKTVYNDYSKEPPSEQTIQSWTTAATCAYSWLVLGGEHSVEHVGDTFSDRLQLCRTLLAVVHLLFNCNPAVSDSALDACEACLSAVRAISTTTAAARSPRTALQMLAHVAALVTPILARDNVPNSINEELLSALITCCVALGECHAHTIVQAAESTENSHDLYGARQLLELLLAAQSAPGHYPLHETRSNLVFSFWYTLQDEVLNIVDREKEVHPVWREVYSQLLTTLVIKSEAPDDQQLTRDDLELLRCYRQDIADTVIYCFGILGDWCWTTLESTFSSATTESRREAALHVFGALADVAPSHSASPALVALMQHAVHIARTSTNKRMLNTALECLGGYASWLSCVQDARAAELCRECVSAAGAALTRCPTGAALALRKLCADFSAPAAHLAPDIVRAAQSAEARADSWVRRQLVAAAGAALAAAELEVAAVLLLELATSLERDLILQAAEPGRTCSAAECCAALLGALTPRACLGAALLRIIVPALPPYAAHPALVESMFHVLKQAVSSLMENSMPMMPDIAQLIITGFNTCPCASGLDVVKLVVISMGEEWPGARNLLHTSVSASARVLAADPSARPDVTEGLFTLLRAVTKKKPRYMDWLEDVLPELVDLGKGITAILHQCLKIKNSRKQIYL